MSNMSELISDDVPTGHWLRKKAVSHEQVVQTKPDELVVPSILKIITNQACSGPANGIKKPCLKPQKNNGRNISLLFLRKKRLM